MHIINLTVQCKDARGDGTKIVCMNRDYVVRINAQDCGTFSEAPVKKLVVRSGWDYWETDIVQIVEDGRYVLQASLPLIESGKYVDLGICGKETEDSNPIYASTSARYECDNSILSGAIALKTDPILVPLTVNDNRIFKAGEYGADGFYEVDVQVSTKTEETRTVALSMTGGNQTVSPTNANRTMSKVTIQKPTSLIPANIKKDVNIAGVVGTYEKRLTELTADSNKEYLPPAGYDGFSKVTVNTDGLNTEKTLCINESFMYQYEDAQPNITINTSGIINYAYDGTNIVVFTAVGVGSCSITIENKNASGEVTRTVYYSVTVVESGYLKPTGNLYIDENTDGPINAREFETVEVNVQPALQKKEVPITENTSTPIIISADAGYYGLSEVKLTVNVAGSGNLIEEPLEIKNNQVKIDVSAYKYVYINIPVFDGGLEII